VIEQESKARRAYEQICENLAVVLSEGEHLSVMINNVLDLTELEASAKEWGKDPVSMPEAIQGAIASMSSVIDQTALPVVCEIEPNLPLVRGDKDRLTQVVRNLLSNALKFADRGEVRVCCKRQGDEVVASVTDAGPGVPVELQEEIFERFRQGGDALTGKPPGLGLGLAICKEILKVHNGRIWVESRPGSGSTFYFALPAVACEIEQAKAAERAS
jgi:signal transduction histidine kinase